MEDGEALCMNCGRREYKLIAAANRQDFRDSWKTAGAEVNWEDSQLYCVHCNERIESAYAEDEVIA